MTVLADLISVERRFARSSNLERDTTRVDPLRGYVVTARALDVVERVAAAAETSAGGAWSLTGPYGSGKSSLALLLDAAFGPASEARRVAWTLIDDASAAVGESVRRAHERLGLNDRGFNRAVVTASREPISITVLRALHGFVLQRFGKLPSARQFAAAGALRAALDDASSSDPRRVGPSPAALVEIARAIAEDAPLLIVIDEFGKNLEAIGDGVAADPYLLQQLVEAGHDRSTPMFVLTLQHMAFEDYVIGLDDQVRREWSKVQGRFEDIVYVESAAQVRSLAGSVFRVNSAALARRIAKWSKQLAGEMSAFGIPDLREPEVIASCYPLHPLAAAVLPELCSRYGQHERSLFSFLTETHPAAAASFLARTSHNPRGALPSIGLDNLYDYFVADRAVAGSGSSQGSRWTEVATRIRDAHGLTEIELSMAKAVAVLNLVATSGTLRASSGVLEHLSPGATGALDALVEGGLLTFRDFSDEYRIWHGTDTDIGALLEAARDRVRREPLARLLTSIGAPHPLVAARHSAQNDILRVFVRRYVEGGEELRPPDPFAPHDGEVVLVVGERRQLPRVTGATPETKPVVAALPVDMEPLAANAREVAAIRAVLDEGAVSGDWVARRELGERLAEAQVGLDHALDHSFRSDTCRWYLLGEDSPTELVSGRGTAALSAAADLVYASTPRVRNEVLNRTELTSQGAKARRLLLEAMIEKGDAPQLGLEGYGPEVAMYRAVLERTGLHGYDSRNDTMVFRDPTEQSFWRAWDILEGEFKRARARRINLNDVYASLLSPPVGMKRGSVPVVVTAGLLAFSDEVAIYEHGTFKPVLTPELSERMVRNPGHFDLKHFANNTGARRQVIEALAAELELRPRFRKHRVANVLSIVGHLVGEFRQLDNYTRRTKDLSPAAVATRNALASAVEPDELLFGALPVALGYPPVPAMTKSYRSAKPLATHVAGVLDELRGTYGRLLDTLLSELLDACVEHSRLAVTGQAAALMDEILDPEVRAFVLALGNYSAESDRDWIGAVATVVAKKAPAEWTDADRERFGQSLAHQIPAFQRLVALHAERRAVGDGFDALRVTITRSDGIEHICLVGVDDAHRQSAMAALEDIITTLADATGSQQRAQHTLLALLSEQMLPEHDHKPLDHVVYRPRDVNHG